MKFHNHCSRMKHRRSGGFLSVLPHSTYHGPELIWCPALRMVTTRLVWKLFENTTYYLLRLVTKQLEKKQCEVNETKSCCLSLTLGCAPVAVAETAGLPWQQRSEQAGPPCLWRPRGPPPRSSAAIRWPQGDWIGPPGGGRWHQSCPCAVGNKKCKDTSEIQGSD